MRLLLALAAAAAAFDCASVGDAKHDLSSLGGARSVVTSRFVGASYLNTTYTLDICRALERDGGDDGIVGGRECPGGAARACAVRRLYPLDGAQGVVQEVIALAGELGEKGGAALDAKATPIEKGVRVEMGGGAHFLHDPASHKRRQRVVVDFVCDVDKKGTEGFWETEDKWKGSAVESKEVSVLEDEDHAEHQLKHDGAALVWDSYEAEDKGEDRADVLRLTWATKLVCAADDKPGGDKGDKPDGKDPVDPPEHAPSSEGWGFFTWLVVIAFLGTAAYLILGSWFNYQRYGARGWDLVPHSDFIRDMPYLAGDWVRKVFDTVQGGGGRGGYTAV